MERPLGADRPAAGVALLQPAADVAQLGVVQAAAPFTGLLLQLHRVQALDGTSARYKTSAQVYRDRQIHKPQVLKKRGCKFAFSCLLQVE